MMKRATGIAALVICLCLQGFGRSSTTDSLIEALRRPMPDTLKIAILSDLAFAYAPVSPDTAMRYVQQQEEIARKLNSPRYNANALNDRAIALFYKGDYAGALTANKQALAIRQQIGDLNLVMSSLNKIALVYHETGNYEMATSVELQALQVAQQLGNDGYIGVTLNALSTLLQKVKKYDDAVLYSRRALHIAVRAGDTAHMASAAQTLEGILERNGRLDSARYYQLLAIDLLEKTEGGAELAKAYNNMGVLCRQQQRNAEALRYYGHALAIARAVDNKNDIAFYAANLGSAMVDEGKVDSGYALLQLARTNSNMPEVRRTVYAGLATYYILKNRHDSAIQYNNLYHDITDTIYSASSAQQINELMTRYETGQKEQQIAILEKQNTINRLVIGRRNITIAVIVVSFAAVALLGVAYYSRRRQQHRARLQQEILNQQRLASRAVLAAEELERQRIAGDLHDGIGQMFSAVKMNLSGIAARGHVANDADRQLLDNTLALVDESCREVRIISHQMMPDVLLRSGLAAALRDFINKIDETRLKINLETYGLNAPLDPNTGTVLYRMIQEAVTNVIKHAQATTLDIQVHKDADSITVTVEDNGRGFDLQAARANNGIGLNNIEARAAFLNGKVDYDTAPGKGTLIAIYIPYSKV